MSFNLRVSFYGLALAAVAFWIAFAFWLNGMVQGQIAANGFAAGVLLMSLRPSRPSPPNE